MKLPISVLAVSTLISTALAAAPIKATVQTYKDKHCKHALEEVTLKYLDTPCKGICKSTTQEFKSYKVIKHPDETTFLFATAFEFYGGGPCFSQLYINTTGIDQSEGCVAAYKEHKKYDISAGHLRLELFAP